jgi:hypothetical protein
MPWRPNGEGAAVSIPVEIPDLGEALAGYGPGYLVTTGADLRPHIAQLEFVLHEATLHCHAGRRSCANAALNPSVAMVWPPLEPGGYSLIADGTVGSHPVGDGADRLAIHVTRAVLHRPAPPVQPAPGSAETAASVGGACLSDCAPVALPDHHS